MSEQEEQKTANDSVSDSKCRARSGGVSFIWGLTFFVAAAIVGFCVFIALGNKKEPDKPVIATQSSAQPVKVVSRPYVPPKVEVPVEEDKPKEVVDIGPPQLLLDNLAGTLKLSVPFLKIRNKIPLEYTCYRSNISPAMDWEGAPDGTKSFVVFLEKQTPSVATKDEPFVSWILFNVPGDVSGVPKGQPKKPELENGMKYAKSDTNNIGYIGPCDSKGSFTYSLRVFALDSVLDLKPGIHKHDLIRAMNGHIIDAAEQEFIHYYRL